MKKRVAIIDYGMGNLHSVLRAWEAVGAESRLVISPLEIGEEDIVIFPGQGAIIDAMRLLRERGFDKFISEWVGNDKPFFGICLGLQALFDYSVEGDCECLKIFRGNVVKLRVPKGVKVPHMGWDNVKFSGRGEGLLEGIDREDDQFYFVHSYCVESSDKEIIFGTTEYGGHEFVSCIRRGNLFACQFHPEKSQSKGLQLYKNFLETLR